VHQVRHLAAEDGCELRTGGLGVLAWGEVGGGMEKWWENSGKLLKKGEHGREMVKNDRK